MTSPTLLVGFFVLAAAGDFLSVHWHRYREERRVVPASLLSVVLETLGWVPVWFAVEWDDIRILVVSALGAAVGTAWAVKS